MPTHFKLVDFTEGLPKNSLSSAVRQIQSDGSGFLSALLLELAGMTLR